MTFNWADYLDLARELADSTPVSALTEAKLRASISRAYYAALCSAHNHLRDVDGDTDIPKGRVHEYVRGKFARGPTLARQRVGSDLGHLWTARVFADYRDEFPGVQSRATMSLEYASRVLHNLSLARAGG